MRRNELAAAKQAVEVSRRSLEAAQNRRDHYQQLVASGLTAAEVTQEVSKAAAGILHTASSIFDTVAAIAPLVPEVGSPFAMKYGGKQAALSSSAWSMLGNRLADVADTTSRISGFVATYERREQEWRPQLTQADFDVERAERDLAAAEIRQSISERSLEIHQKTLEQHDEVIDFYRDKFSNLGQYIALCRSHQQLHRSAYVDCAAMAALAERAFHFERPGETTRYIGGEWDASRSGLHAGERLIAALQRMERRFIETDERTDEIPQSFSVNQLDPAALVALRETGECEFKLPEYAFDLFYPGDYRRRIRGVRLTIPSVTGGYTDVSARLTQLRSWIRTHPHRR